MNDQFIQGVIFDWNKIDDDSYLKQIEALKNLRKRNSSAARSNRTNISPKDKNFLKASMFNVYKTK